MDHARNKYCNKSKASLRTADEKPALKPAFVSDIVWAIVTYTKSTVDKALLNLTEFCEDAHAIGYYQRASCPFFDKIRCPQTYRSTKFGRIKASTQHRPIILQSTKHAAQNKKQNIFESMFRSSNLSQELFEEPKVINESVPEATEAGISLTDTSEASRRKRHAESSSPMPSTSGSPAISKVSGGQSSKSHVNPNPVHSKKGTKSRQGKSKHSAKSEKIHRLRSPKHGPQMRTENTTHIKQKSKPHSLKIRLPLTFENASAHGWVTWQPSNSSELLKNDTKPSTTVTTTSTTTDGPAFRAQNTTDTPKLNLRMGTTIVHDKGMYDPISRRRRNVEANANDTQIIVEVQDVKPINDSRRYFQSRRFR